MGRSWWFNWACTHLFRTFLQLDYSNIIYIYFRLTSRIKNYIILYSQVSIHINKKLRFSLFRLISCDAFNFQITMYRTKFNNNLLPIYVIKDLENVLFLYDDRNSFRFFHLVTPFKTPTPGDLETLSKGICFSLH